MGSSRTYYSQKADMVAMRRLTMVTLLWLVLGLGVGAVMALLYAPKSGKKIRYNLSRTLEDGFDSGQDALAPVVKRLEKEVGELRQTMEDRISQRG